jgi:hypothetical protein
MAENKLILSTDETAALWGVSRTTVINIVKAHPGLGFRAGNAYKVPAAHAERVMRGERPADIAAEVRTGGAPRAA